jgi:hypothetical protein
MERSTFSEDNSVPFRIWSSLLSNLMLLYSCEGYAAGKNGIPVCRTQQVTCTCGVGLPLLLDQSKR